MSLRLNKPDSRAKSAATAATTTTTAPRSAAAKTTYPPRTSNTYSNSNSNSNDDAADEEKKRILANRYKTKLCKNYVASGSCPYEVRCMFAHGEEEMRTAEQNVADGLTTEEAIKAFQHRNNSNSNNNNGGNGNGNHHHHGHNNNSNSRANNNNGGGRFAGRRGTFTSSGAGPRPFNSRAEEPKTAADAAEASHHNSDALTSTTATSSSSNTNINNMGSAAAAAATCMESQQQYTSGESFEEAAVVIVEDKNHNNNSSHDANNNVNGENYFFTYRHNPYDINVLSPEDRLYTYSADDAAYFAYGNGVHHPHHHSNGDFYYGAGAEEGEEGMWMGEMAQQQQMEYFPVEMVPNGSSADLATPMATVEDSHMCSAHGGCTAAEFGFHNHHNTGAEAMIVEP